MIASSPPTCDGHAVSLRVLVSVVGILNFNRMEGAASDGSGINARVFVGSDGGCGRCIGSRCGRSYWASVSSPCAGIVL